jgi:F5/8 type C domain
VRYRTGHHYAPWAVVVSVYTTLAAVATWPLVLRLTSVVPHDVGDPLLSTWILWWNAHAVPLTARWWDAPMFSPSSGALALSEHLLGLSLIATPMQWLGVEPITAYNTLFLVSFPLCAIAAHALAHDITGRHDAATVAGLAYGFTPYRVSQISHVQMLWVFWTPLALLALHRYAREGGRRWLIVFAAMWIGQALSNTYFLIFLPLLLALWIAWFLTSGGRMMRVGVVAAVWACATLPLAPIIARYYHVTQRFAFERTYGEIRSFSANVGALLSPPPLAVASLFLPSNGNPEQQLFPGFAILALVIVAAGCAMWRARREPARRSRLRPALWVVAAAALAVAATAPVVAPWRINIGGMTILSVTSVMKPLTVALWCGVFAIAMTATAASAWAERSAFAFYGVAAAVMYAFSFGPEPTLGGVPFWYRPPYAWLLEVPGFSSVRVPARFAMLAVLCLAVAAAIAFARLSALVPRRAARALVVLVLAIAVADGWIRALPLVDLPRPVAALDVPRDAAVVELPAGTVAGDTAAMYRSMYHGHALVNGYSGFEPVHYTILREALEAGDADALDPIAAGRALVILDDGGRRIGMRPTKAVAPIWRGVALRIHAAAVSSGTIDPAALADGDRRSYWDSGAPQCGTESMTIDLGAAHRVDAIVVSLGTRLHDYPRSMVIEASDDLRAWNAVWSGRTASRAVAGALEDPAMIPLRFELAPVRARWLRLRQIGADARAHWSVAELKVHGE